VIALIRKELRPFLPFALVGMLLFTGLWIVVFDVERAFFAPPSPLMGAVLYLAPHLGALLGYAQVAVERDGATLSYLVHREAPIRRQLAAKCAVGWLLLALVVHAPVVLAALWEGSTSVMGPVLQWARVKEIAVAGLVFVPAHALGMFAASLRPSMPWRIVVGAFLLGGFGAILAAALGQELASPATGRLVFALGCFAVALPFLALVRAGWERMQDDERAPSPRRLAGFALFHVALIVVPGHAAVSRIQIEVAKELNPVAEPSLERLHFTNMPSLLATQWEQISSQLREDKSGRTRVYFDRELGRILVLDVELDEPSERRRGAQQAGGALQVALRGDGRRFSEDATIAWERLDGGGAFCITDPADDTRWALRSDASDAIFERVQGGRQDPPLATRSSDVPSSNRLPVHDPLDPDPTGMGVTIQGVTGRAGLGLRAFLFTGELLRAPLAVVGAHLFQSPAAVWSDDLPYSAWLIGAGRRWPLVLGNVALAALLAWRVRRNLVRRGAAAWRRRAWTSAVLFGGVPLAFAYLVAEPAWSGGRPTSGARASGDAGARRTLLLQSAEAPA